MQTLVPLGTLTLVGTLNPEVKTLDPALTLCVSIYGFEPNMQWGFLHFVSCK